MGLPSIPSPPHLYPQALQLKLYQAFIFSVPVLFSIILFLLFYLFYLKRRTSNHSSSPTIIPWRLNPATPSPFEVDLKEELKPKLSIIIFDEDIRSRESQCCVCLGEFEMKEQLHQIPSCNHVFHIDCIHHWLQANTTCPLCRGSVLVTTRRKSCSSDASPPSGLNFQQGMDTEAGHQTQLESSELQQASMSSITVTNFADEDQLGHIEGSTSGRTRLTTEPSNLEDLTVPLDNGTQYSHQDSVVVQISMHTS
ncbi:probable E3 ubiquitin-protein ligase RHA4A isoform X1 [Telopea speciosissima]|uniref:probable E3 ubiquitin-protein ligase RHA4A isoform X1 n=1 Tax=Telopea speciosissima TaxID=54955 RepID=UPI001CC5EE38|nr:probable E3 ubiquitin-protein ligase RHA4A isoform X1 [Telopea speciosissima]